MSDLRVISSCNRQRIISCWDTAMIRCAEFVFHTDHTHPPGTQLLLWDDVNLPVESLQEVKSAKENMYRRAYGGNII